MGMQSQSPESGYLTFESPKQPRMQFDLPSCGAIGRVEPQTETNELSGGPDLLCREGVVIRESLLYLDRVQVGDALEVT